MELLDPQRDDAGDTATAWRDWHNACRTLAAAEHEGLPPQLLEQLADDVISRKLVLDGVSLTR